MGDLTKWHGLKPEYIRYKKELFPGLSVDYDEDPSTGEIFFRFGGKESRHPIEPAELLLGRYAVEVIQDSFLSKLNQFAIKVTPRACTDEDFAKLKAVASGAPVYCTPWMAEEDVGLRLAAPTRVEVRKTPLPVVVAMMCQIRHSPALPKLPPSPTLVFIKQDTGGALRRTVHEIENERNAKLGKGPAKAAPAPRARLDTGTTTEFFNVDVGALLPPGTYSVVGSFGIFESEPLTLTVGPEGKTGAPQPMLVPISGQEGTTKVHAGPFNLLVRHKVQGDVIEYALGTNPKAKVSFLDGTTLGPTPVRFPYGRRLTLRLVDRTKELRQVVTLLVDPGDPSDEESDSDP